MEKVTSNEEIKKWLSGNRYPLTDENVVDITRILTSWGKIYTDKNGAIYDVESALKAGIDLKTLNDMDDSIVSQENV